MNLFNTRTRQGRKQVVYAILGVILLALHTNAVYMWAKYPHTAPDYLLVNVILAGIVTLVWGVLAFMLFGALVGWLVTSLIHGVTRWIDAPARYGQAHVRWTSVSVSCCADHAPTLSGHQWPSLPVTNQVAYRKPADYEFDYDDYDEMEI